MSKYIKINLKNGRISYDYKGDNLLLIKILENVLVDILLRAKRKDIDFSEYLESEFARIKELANKVKTDD